MSNFIDFQQQLLARLTERVQAIEALGNTATPEDEEDLATLREQLEIERATRSEVQRISDSAPPPPILDRLSVIIGGNQNIFERDWRSVFEFFPGTQARFQEIVNLDQQEEQLFQDRHDPALRPVWQQTRALVLAAWEPFKQDVTSRLTFLSAPRRFTVTLSGLVHDQDNLSRDEEIPINDPNPNTMRFGERVSIIKTFIADNEVSLRLNVNCRFIVSDGTNPPLLEIRGDAQCFDDDDLQGSVGINTQISPGQTSGDFRAGDSDDFGIVRFSFDLAP